MAPHTYRTNYGLNKLKKMVHKTCSFFICPIYKSEISDLFCVCFLVQLRYISRIFPMYISD